MESISESTFLKAHTNEDMQALLRTILASIGDFFKGIEMVSAAVKACESKLRGEVESMRADVEARESSRAKVIMEATEAVTKQLSRDLDDEKEARGLALESLSKRMDRLGEQLELLTKTGDAGAGTRLLPADQACLSPAMTQAVADIAREEVAKRMARLRLEASTEARKEGDASIDVTSMSTVTLAAAGSEDGLSSPVRQLILDMEASKIKLQALEEDTARMQAETARLQSDFLVQAEKWDVGKHEAVTRSEMLRLELQVREVVQSSVPLSQKVESVLPELQRVARESRSVACRVDVAESQLRNLEREHKPIFAGLEALRGEVTLLNSFAGNSGCSISKGPLPSSYQKANLASMQPSGSLSTASTAPSSDGGAATTHSIAGSWKGVCSPAAASRDRLSVTSPLVDVSDAKNMPRLFSPPARGGNVREAFAGPGVAVESAIALSLSAARQRSQSRGRGLTDSIGDMTPGDMMNSMERLVGKIDRVLTAANAGQALTMSTPGILPSASPSRRDSLRPCFKDTLDEAAAKGPLLTSARLELSASAAALESCAKEEGGAYTSRFNSRPTASPTLRRPSIQPIHGRP